MVISEPVNIDLFLDVASLQPLFSTFRVEKSDDQKYVCVCRVGISSNKQGFLKSWKIVDLGKVSERSSKKRLKVLLRTNHFFCLEILFTITICCGKK